MYPAFVNCTTIDWFSEWPQDALLEVAEKYLESMELGDDEVRNNVPALKHNSFNCKIQSLDVDRVAFRLWNFENNSNFTETYCSVAFILSVAN